MHIPSILDLPPTCGLAPYSHTPDDRGTGCLQVVQPLGEKNYVPYPVCDPRFVCRRVHGVGMFRRSCSLAAGK